MQLANPTIRLTLTPHFDSDGVRGLSVRLHLENPDTSPEKPMFIFNTFTDNVPAPPLNATAIHAVDDQGALLIRFVDLPKHSRNTKQHWWVDRQTKGDVILAYDVAARHVDAKTPVGTRIDLRRDQGGLQGVGTWFLPLLLSDKTYTNVLQWNLPKDAPEDTRCIWSYGEGAGPIIRTGRANTLWNTVYMVGPVQSYPEEIPADQSGFSACYWFGSLPDILGGVKGYNTELFPKMMRFFEMKDEAYRIFIRKAAIGYGGTGFLGSYVLEYDHTVLEQTNKSLTGLFTHEMVHSFSWLDAEEDEYDNAWFTEGIAELYGALLPYRFGLRRKDYLLEHLASHVDGYFTNPRINMDIRNSAELFFSDWYAVWIPYKRGCAYLLLMDCLLRRAAGIFDLMTNGPLDDIVIDMARRTKAGEILRGKDWLAYCRKYLGNDSFPVEKHYEMMLRGETLDFSGTFFGSPSNPFVRRDQRILQFGFARQSLRTFVIDEVEKGSPADLAGLKDGDRIISASSHNLCTDYVDRTYVVVVDRDGKELTIEYLPRVQQTTISWRLKM